MQHHERRWPFGTFPFPPVTGRGDIARCVLPEEGGPSELVHCKCTQLSGAHRPQLLAEGAEEGGEACRIRDARSLPLSPPCWCPGGMKAAYPCVGERAEAQGTASSRSANKGMERWAKN